MINEEERKKFYFFKNILNLDIEGIIFSSNRMVEVPKNSGRLVLCSILAKHSLLNSYNNIEKYNEEYKRYENILDKTIELARILKLNDSIEICFLFTYLLTNGYFSYNDVQYYNQLNLKNIEGLFPFDIMTGRGVCLNYSSMLADLLNKTEFSSAIINNYMMRIKKKEINDKISLNKTKSNIIFRFIDGFSIINKIVGNHCFCLIKDNNFKYIYDPTNTLIVGIKNKKMANLVNGSGKFYLKPYASYIVNPSNKSRKLLEEFHLDEEFNIVGDYDFYKSKFDIVCEKIERNKYILDNFKSEINSDILFIYNKVKQFKR